MKKNFFILFKMQQILIICVCMCVFAKPVLSQDSNINNELDQMEEFYFHHTYDQEPVNDRVQRLEKQLFGSYDSGSPIDKRVTNLYGVFKAVCNSDNSAPNVSQADNSNQVQSYKQQSKQTYKQSKTASNYSNYDNHQTVKKRPTGSNSNYPIVSKMEMKVFHQEYTDEPLTERLDRLELKLYGTKSTLPSLSERVDNLKSTLDMDSSGKTATKKHSDWMTDDELEAQNMNLNNNTSSGVNTGMGNMGMGSSMGNMGMGSGMGNMGMGSGMGNMGMGSSMGNMGMGSGMGNMGMGSGMGNMGMGSGMGNMGMGSSMGNMGMGSGMGNNFNNSFLNKDNFFGSSKPKNPKKLAKEDLKKYGVNYCLNRLEQIILGKNNSSAPIEQRVSSLDKVIFPENTDYSKQSIAKRVENLLVAVPIENNQQNAQPRANNFNNGFNQPMNQPMNQQMYRPSFGYNSNYNYSSPFGSTQMSQNTMGFGNMSISNYGMGGMGMGGMSMGNYGMGMGGMGIGGFGNGGFNSGFSPFGSFGSFSNGFGSMGAGVGLIYP